MTIIQAHACNCIEWVSNVVPLVAGTALGVMVSSSHVQAVNIYTTTHLSRNFRSVKLVFSWSCAHVCVCGVCVCVCKGQKAYTGNFAERETKQGCTNF
jgi:hypothetical protein